MMVTDKPWCDLYFYHPKLKPVLIKVMRDQIAIDKINSELEIAIKSAKEIIEKIK